MSKMEHFRRCGLVLVMVVAVLAFYTSGISWEFNKEEFEFRSEEPRPKIAKIKISSKISSTLQRVAPIFEDMRTDKCIHNITAESGFNFSADENTSIHTCFRKNVNVIKMYKESNQRLDWNITFSFYRFLAKKPNVKIVEVGGNVGDLLPKLVRVTGVKKYVVLEPVPSFYEKLTTNIKQRSLNHIVTPYNFGLGKTEEKISISPHGVATSLKKKSVSNATETLLIVKVADFFVQLGIGCHRLDLLTINCEGCEFDVIEALTSSSLIKQIDYVQFQPHASVFTDKKKYRFLYCRLRQLLSRTHKVAYEYPHVWEAWRRKGIPKP